MKKFLPVAAALVLALAGCGSAPKTEEAPAEPEVQEEEVVEEEEADQGESIDWTDAKDAAEAAKGAGFEKFGVIDKFKVGDLEFKEPTFAYAGGVAQATYETPATMIYLRKAVDTYETPLSDRQLDEFTAHWHKIIEGIDITCYGPAKGAVTVATWSDGNKSYGLTFQGLGGEEMTMDVDELATIVKGIKEADADQKAEEKKEEEEEEQKTEEKKEQSSSNNSSSSNSGSQQSGLLSAKGAEAQAEAACQGTCTSIDLVTTKQYGQCWYAVCVDANGNVFEYYINNSGCYIIDEKGAQRETVAPTPSKNGEHYEGEPVTIYGSVYAEWHQANGQWVATFITYNGTQIFAQPAPAGGGWVFYAYRNGQQVQVIYSDVESSTYGEVGPGGVSSHWCNINNYHDWY